MDNHNACLNEMEIILRGNSLWKSVEDPTEVLQSIAQACGDEDRTESPGNEDADAGTEQDASASAKEGQKKYLALFYTSTSVDTSFLAIVMTMRSSAEAEVWKLLKRCPLLS